MKWKNLAVKSVVASGLTVVMLVNSVTYAAAFQTGWWVDKDNTSVSKMVGYATSNQNTLMLLAGWFSSTSQVAGVRSYLQAVPAGVKLIVGINAGPVPTMSKSEYQSAINQLKGEANLWGWYIGDEPELVSDESTARSRAATAKQYYDWAKEVDNHPVLISFNQPYTETQWTYQSFFYPAVDVIGIHSYPFWSTGGEFGTSEGRGVYEVWRRGLATAKSLGKDFIASGQGLGDGHGDPYKTPTKNELRYQTFSAIVQGIDKVLFWIDSWAATSGMTQLVNDRFKEIQSIGPEMNKGVTNDSRVSMTGATTNQITYRYGTSTSRQVLLAVNHVTAGQSFSGVKFTIAGAGNGTVTVDGENRTLQMANGSFADSFSQFAAHAYIIGGAGVTAGPTQIPTRIPTPTIPRTPTPTRPGTPTVIPIGNRYEGENGVLAGLATIEACSSTCSGGARVGYIGAGDANTLTIRNVYSATAGTKSIEIAYSNGSGANQAAWIQVNSESKSNYTFPPTGAFTSVANMVITVNLNAGNNTITFGNSSGYAPDIDVIIVGGSGIGGNEADANGDGRVDGLDYVVWINHYGAGTNLGKSAGDFNKDTNVDGLDYIVLLNNYSY